MEFDYSKLKGKIKEVYGTQTEFANAIGLSFVSISKKLNNLRQFKQSDIVKINKVLNIAEEDIPIYFFTPKEKKG
jgi:transcriptional regulator with XRE-family HTH domain